MNKTTFSIAASLLSLASLALITLGLGGAEGSNATGWLWQLGLGLTALAMLLTFATRFVPEGRDPGAESEAESGGDAGTSQRGGLSGRQQKAGDGADPAQR